MRAQMVIREAPDHFDKRDGPDCLLAIQDAAIVGAIVYDLCDDDGFGHVHSLGVALDRRRIGIGIDLKQQVLDNCTAAGATAVWSEVDRNNVKMQGLNEKLGISYTPNPLDGKFFYYTARLVATLEEDEEGLACTVDNPQGDI